MFPSVLLLFAVVIKANLHDKDKLQRKLFSLQGDFDSLRKFISEIALFRNMRHSASNSA